MTGADYTPVDIGEAMRVAGIGPGDTVFSHSNIGFFGVPSLGRSAEGVCKAVMQGITAVLGSRGTFVQPAFTYSFGRGEPFDPDATPSRSGMLSEYVRGLAGSIRSHDPMISTVAIGGGAREMLSGLPMNCYGPGSVWDRLLSVDAWLCNLNMDFGTTFAHHIEALIGVPYRYVKRFVGDIGRNGRRQEIAVDYYAADRSIPDYMPDWARLDSAVRETCPHSSILVGRGVINAVRLSDLAALLRREIGSNPFFLTRAGQAVPRRDTTAAASAAKSPPISSVDDVVPGLWSTVRATVSPGAAHCIRAVARLGGMDLREFPTGTYGDGVVVPECWIAREAALARLNGEVVLSADHQPLHLGSGSTSFSGEIDNASLLRRVICDPRDPDAIPAVALGCRAEWRLACSERQKSALMDERYHLEIRTEQCPGTLLVAEAVIPGREPGETLVVATLGDAAIGAADLGGVAAALRLAQQQRADPRGAGTLRIAIAPDTLALNVYLASGTSEHAAPRRIVRLGALGGAAPLTLLARNSEARCGDWPSFHRADPASFDHRSWDWARPADGSIPVFLLDRASASPAGSLDTPEKVDPRQIVAAAAALNDWLKAVDTKDGVRR